MLLCSLVRHFQAPFQESSSGEMSHSFWEGDPVCTVSLCLNANKVMCLFESISSNVWSYW